MPPSRTRQKSDRSSMLAPCCLPVASAAEPAEPSSARHWTVARSPFSAPQLLRHERQIRADRTQTVHRCLLIPEILALILEFIRRFDESPESELKWDRTLGKRTLASLARTCHALGAPALDVLWMRLDSLDPLIKVLPRRMWARKHYPFVVRMFLGEKQWATFRKYAERVKFVCGPCWRVPTTVQYNIIAALAHYPKASLPLLPNLTELVWSELKMSHIIDPSVSLIKYFAGPGVTSLSLSLICWPNKVSSQLTTLTNLPNLCPNVTSFTAFFPRSSYNDHSREIGQLVQQWPHLRILRSCALSQPVMDKLTSRQSLDTLSIELNNSNTAFYVGRLPPHVQSLFLGGNSAAICLRYFETIRAGPMRFHLRVGADDSTTADMEELVGALPTRLDKARLCILTIDLTSSYWSTPASDTFSLSPLLLASFASFTMLRELDVSTFCAAELDDRGYEAWVAGMRALTSLKVGVSDVSMARPAASVGAVLAVLRACRELETLWIVFDGSVMPPLGDAGAARKDQDESEQNEWGVTNHHITHLRVGHSPIGEDEKGMAELARCLKTVMPRLENIRAGKYASEVGERWDKVQEMMLAGR